jgi:hypothetical protein
MKYLPLFALLIATPAVAQQADLAAILSAQRNQAMDVVANCALKAGELQTKLDTANKEIEDLKAKLPKD